MLLSLLIRLKIIRSYDLLVTTWNLRFFRKLFRALASDLGLTVHDVEYVIRRSKNEGTTFFIKKLPELGRAFDRALSTCVLEIPLGLKKLSKRNLPHFMGSIFLKVFDKNGRLRNDADEFAVRTIRQVCFFFYKVNLPHKWADEKRIAKSFVETDNELNEARPNQLIKGASSSPSNWEKFILACSSLVIGRLFNKIDLQSIRPKHSSGSVVHGYNQLEKYELPRQSKKPWTTLGSYAFPFMEQATKVESYPVWSHFDLFSTQWGIHDKSEVLFVPKDSRGPRLICREPKDYQYLQQGFKDYAMQVIENHSLTCGQVNFSSQEINREMSRLGSIDRNWSTLDLKDASDRNSLSLVRLLWSTCPEALAYLLGSRTNFTTVHGKTLRLAKFAPMGSALCFPVMAMNIFALLVSSYAYEAQVTLEQSAKHIYVYGDDIIVPTWFANTAMHTLEWFGFRVNKDKSFVDSHFTESCGADWFKGTLVTPVRLRCQALLTRPNVVSLVKTGNELSKNGLHRTAEVLYKLVEGLIGTLPYGSSDCSYLARWCRPEDVSVYNIHVKVGRRKIYAWTICPERKFSDEGPYTRLERVLPMMGSELNQIPGLGEFTPPKRFILRKRMVLIA